MEALQKMFEECGVPVHFIDATPPPKERPILFSAPMVRAILAGEKTMARRVIKPQPTMIVGGAPRIPDRRRKVPGYDIHANKDAACPYGVPGDRLWVRETFAYYPDAEHVIYREREGAELESAGVELKGIWKPSIHMPRWASRITLEVISVRVERLQEISEADAAAEGANHWWDAMTLEQKMKVYSCGIVSIPLANFRDLWQSINGGGSWDRNPWVWAIEFKAVSPA